MVVAQDAGTARVVRFCATAALCRGDETTGRWANGLSKLLMDSKCQFVIVTWL